jgi:hypothetical protein
MAVRESHRLLLQAKLLRGQLQRRQRDKEFERTGGETIYAIDNDVLTTATAPWNTHHQAYLRRLVNDDKEARESFAYILAEFLFRGRDPSTHVPFMILSPGDVELEGIWNRVYLEAQREDVALDEGLQQVVELAKKFQGDTPEELYLLVRKLLECLQHRSGSIAQLHRVVRLQDSGRVLPATRALSGNRPLFPEPDERENRVLRRIESDWLAELNRRRPPNQPVSSAARTAYSQGRGDRRLTNNEIDAAVLAQVEWINRKFAEEQPEPTRHLCFLTGDLHIERIAQRRGVAEAYIRDPSCFLADDNFFSTAGVPTPDFLASPQSRGPEGAEPALGEARGSSGNSLSEWLSLILPDMNVTERADDMRTRDQAAGDVKRTSTEWAEYLKSAAAGAGFREADAEFQDRVMKLATTLLDVGDAREFGNILARLRVQAHEKANEAMTRFGVSGVMASFLTLKETTKWPSRIIPVVRISSWPRAVLAIAELLQARTLHAAQANLVEAQIHKLREEDGTGYTVFIVYALAFAFAGEWESALKVSRAALSISSHYAERPTSTSMVRGVEAAYLCAVFSRYCALDLRALDESKKWLATARSRHEAMGGSSGDDVRFDAEELAIRVTGINFTTFLGRENDLLGQLMGFWSIRELSQRHKDLFERAAADSARDVAIALQQQLATNFLQLQLLAKLHGEDPDVLAADAKDMLAVLAQVAEVKPHLGVARSAGRPPAALTLFIFICASALFDPPAAGWDVAAKRETLFDQLRDFGRKLRVMPYDAKRAERMIDMVAQHLG